MRRIPLLLLIIAILVLLVLAAHLQLQPEDSACVIRSGEKLRLVAGRVGWAARYGTVRCSLPLRQGRLFFDEKLTIRAEDFDIPVQVRFQYGIPDTIAPGWPEGDWCSSLRRRVQGTAGKWLSTAELDDVVAYPRESGITAAKFIAQTLQRDGVATANLTARFSLPPSLQSIRAVPQLAQRAQKRPPVIFIGLDGGDWQLLDRYIAAGVMPNLAALVREGHSGALLTDHPPLSPLLWTTMMTGVDPLQHQILDFVRFHPQTRNKEPITSDQRRAPAIWNIATYGGKSVCAFGLWATYPAEPVRGLMVSDRLFTFLYTEQQPPPGIVFPPAREPWARAVLEHVENSIGYSELKEYLPWLDEPEYRQRIETKEPYGHPVSALRRILIETAVYHQLATSYLSTQNPDLAIVYLQGTDSVGHVFAPYNPPHQPEISQPDFDHYQGVAERYFRHIDSLLGEYRKLVEQRKGILMLASDHGFRWFEGRPTQLSSFAAATAAKWHRNEGMYLLWGFGIRANSTHASRGGITQVAATLLSLVGLPPGQRVTGPPLPGAPRAEAVAADYQMHYQPVKTLSPAPSAGTVEELAKLRALGYIGSGEAVLAPTSLPAGATRTAGSYNNEGLILKTQKRTAEAIAAFEKAISIDPNLASALWNLSDTLFEGERDLVRSDQLLVRALANGLPEGVKYLVGRAIGYQRTGRAERSLALLEGAVESRPQDKELRLFRGRYRIDRGDCRGALEDFVIAQQIAPDDPVPYASAGLAAVCLGDRGAAERNFRRSLEMDPNQPRLRAYLRRLGG